MKQILTGLFLFFTAHLAFSQNDSSPSWVSKLKDFKIKPVAGLQIWSTYTTGMKVFNAQTNQYEAVDNRLNMHIRRSRLGIKGQPYPFLKFNVTASLDLVGKDLLAGTQGGGNNGASPQLRLWNGWVQWKLSPKNDFFHLTMGYLTPQIGRESMTAAFRVTSMEKSWSQNYLRRHLVGIGPGRVSGLNLGGMLLSENKNFGISYNAGVFNPAFTAFGGNSAGARFSPLLTGRVAFHFGDPEFKRYTLGHKVNYFGSRKGLTIALAGARQGQTDLFFENHALGFDWLFNWGNLNLSGDWTWLVRDGEQDEGVATRAFSTKSNTGFARLSYNLKAGEKYVLEPVLIVTQFNGPLTSREQADALSVNAFAGEDHTFSAGLNFYWNPDLKLGLFYSAQSGDAGEAAPGATFNNYFFQGGVGAIQRGDWLGVEVVAIF
ncbi:MAG: hypothetical protein D6714_06965 [Bacteroidetes bacterium]|nr:MAG: hypothetical protein D6714_06965 [Bacteroidota bacterium]